MANDKLNILIVGKGAQSEALALKCSQNPKCGQIYITGENAKDYEYYKKIDIREDDLTSLLVFALENDINLTIPTSEKSIDADIVTFFQSNGQNIFGPTKESSKAFTNKIMCKKFLYKIHAQSPKYGMFNKPAQAHEYLKNSSFPVLIKTSLNCGLQDDKFICTTLNSARNFIDKLFLKDTPDILIEDYTYGHNFTVYFITDGYCAIPINTIGNYKFLNDNDGGQYFDGVGCYCPDYKISQVIIDRLTDIAHNILKELDSQGQPYLGFLGIECIKINEDKFLVDDLKAFPQYYDANALLQTIDDDLIEIFISCIHGFFSDEYENIKLNNQNAVSLCVYSKYENKEIEGLDNTEFNNINMKEKDKKYYSNIGLNFSITKTASTITRAKKYLSEDLSLIKFDGMQYRKDICDNIEL